MSNSDILKKWLSEILRFIDEESERERVKEKIQDVCMVINSETKLK